MNQGGRLFSIDQSLIGAARTAGVALVAATT